MTAVHLLVVMLAAVTAVPKYPKPYSPVDTAYKPDYKKPEYGSRPTNAPVYDSKPDYKKPEYGDKPPYAPVYSSKPNYKKPEYGDKPPYAPVYDSKPDYKKPEYGDKPPYAPKPDYKKPEYESKPAYGPEYDSEPYGTDVKSAREAVRAVINKKDELYKDLDIYETFIQVAAERINLINQRVLPAITLDNSQTDASITLLDQEIDSLRDRAVRDDVTTTAALVSANASSDVIRGQRALVAQIAKNNTDDTRRIAQFQDDLKNFETYFLQELEARLGQLNSLLANERQNLKTVTTFVDGRKCEQGYIALWVDADTVSVQFVSKFNQAPSVDIVLSAFVSSTNVPFVPDRHPSGNTYPQSTYGDDTQGDDLSYTSDVQKVQIVVSDVTDKGFTARVINKNPVNFYFNKAIANYVACQNLNTEVYL